MTKKQEGKKGRTRYSAEFKQQALLRAQRDGVAVTARDLGLQGAQLKSALQNPHPRQAARFCH